MEKRWKSNELLYKCEILPYHENGADQQAKQILRIQNNLTKYDVPGILMTELLYPIYSCSKFKTT